VLKKLDEEGVNGGSNADIGIQVNCVNKEVQW